MKVNKKYPFSFYPGDYSEMKAVPEDVFYEKDGRLYSQFFKGQFIPIEIWNELFDKKESNIKESSQEIEEIEEIEEKIEEVKIKTPKRRRKSIIKK